MQTGKFKTLLSPFQIKNLNLKNRMVKAPMGMRYAGERDGYVNETYMAYYEALARGGVGMLLTEATSVDFPQGGTGARHLRLDDDKYIPGLSNLTKLIHRYDASCFMQLNHGGPALSRTFSGLHPVAASAIGPRMGPKKGDQPREMTLQEIETVVANFAAAALRALEAGFDGIEIHGAHFYLINSFLSRAWNKRKDAYGGDVKNRARLAIEIVKAVRDKVGPNYPVGIRINGVEYGADGGITVEDSIATSKMVEEAGVDYIHVSAEGYGDYFYLQWPEQIFRPAPPAPLASYLDGSNRGAGAFVPIAAAIKKTVSIPIITVGRLNPIIAEKILRDGKADLLTFGRTLMADPDFPNKLAAGKLKAIVPCIACLRGWEAGFLGGSVCCTVNASLGREREFEIKPALKPKKILVVGGGPAGMEMARVAALRGHEVLLYEKESFLGGSMRLAALVNEDMGEDLMSLIRYYSLQLKELGVQLKLKTLVSPELVASVRPDVIAISAGGMPTVPSLPGINQRNVIKISEIYSRLNFFLRFLSPMTLGWLTKFYMPVGKRVLIMGGGIHGCELAVFLIKRSRHVTIVEPSDELGTGMVWLIKEKVLNWLTKKGCTMLVGVKYEAIIEDGLTINTSDGKKKTIACDTIIPAPLLRPNTELFQALIGKVPEICLIGDSKEPHLILEAIESGSRNARLV